MENLRKQRAALEALATTLESMEEDTRIATSELQSGAQTTREFIKALQHENPTQLSSAEVEKPLVVMLASSSKWRRALISQILPEGMVLADDPISPDIDEKAIRRDEPEEMVKAIAHAKADKVLSILSNPSSTTTRKGPTIDIVICADQVVCYGDQVREKPITETQAREHLQSYGATRTPAKCITGLVVVAPATSSRIDGTDVALQYFKRVPDRVADALIAKGDIMYCAGSFVVEDPLLAPYLDERVGELESVQGMPKELTRKLLIQAARDLRKHLKEKGSKRHKRD